MTTPRDEPRRQRGPALTTMLAWAASALLFIRQASSGFDAGWFTVAVIVVFVAASAFLLREIAARRRRASPSD